MTMHKQGSALLIIFFIVNTMFLVCWLVWRSTSWGVDLILEKQSYEEQMQALNALGYYAQLLIKSNYPTIINDPMQRTIHFNHWPHEKSAWNASITMHEHEGMVQSMCMLRYQNNIIGSKNFFMYEKIIQEKQVMFVKSCDENHRNKKNIVT